MQSDLGKLVARAKVNKLYIRGCEISEDGFKEFVGELQKMEAVSFVLLYISYSFNIPQVYSNKHYSVCFVCSLII